MEMKQTKRAQAALEFLTTYGWAFLVILIMIGALAYFGVLNPSNLVPDTCTAGEGFTCREFLATAGTAAVPEAQFIVVNTLQSIEIQTITVAETGTTNCGVITDANAPADGAALEAGQVLAINLTCAGDLVDSDRFQGTIDINYKVVGGTLTQKAEVDFSLKAQ